MGDFGYYNLVAIMGGDERFAYIFESQHKDDWVLIGKREASK